jgi:3-oxoacyl-[acyl-carrier protein] reductase
MARRNLNGKVAVITGSSRGIGKAIAIDLAKQGVSIVLNGRNQERLNEAKAAVEKVHSKVITVCCDISAKDAGKNLIKAAVDEFGQLDILVNNVGVSYDHPELRCSLYARSRFFFREDPLVPRKNSVLPL